MDPSTESTQNKPASAGFSLVKRFARNTRGRDLIVGDVHGQFTKLQAALDRVGFDPDAGDRLFSVGDLVDRGPESHLAVEWLDKPWFHAVRGNHEQMAVDFGAGRLQEARLYVMNGGAWNLANSPEKSRAISDRFASLPIAIEIETEDGLVGVIHADCPVQSWDECRKRLASCADPDADPFVAACVWSRSRVQSGMDGGVSGVRAVVVGHTPMDRITSLGNVIYIDTGAWFEPRREFGIIDAATLMAAHKEPAHA